MKHLLLTRGIRSLGSLEELFEDDGKCVDLFNQAEQLILSGDITVEGMNGLYSMKMGLTQSKFSPSFLLSKTLIFKSAGTPACVTSQT